MVIFRHFGGHKSRFMDFFKVSLALESKGDRLGVWGGGEGQSKVELSS